MLQEYQLEDTEYRIAIFGSGKVGKTSIINRFLFESFNDTYQETIEDAYRKTIIIRNKRINLNVIDTAGNYQFPAMRKLAIQKSNGFILTYSLNDQKSLEEARRIYDIIIETKDELDYPVIFVANKCDLPKQEISHADVRNLRNIFRTPFTQHVESSAKLDLNITKIFDELFLLEEKIRESKEAMFKRHPKHSLARLTMSMKRGVRKSVSN